MPKMTSKQLKAEKKGSTNKMNLRKVLEWKRNRRKCAQAKAMVLIASLCQHEGIKSTSKKIKLIAI